MVDKNPIVEREGVRLMKQDFLRSMNLGINMKKGHGQEYRHVASYIAYLIYFYPSKLYQFKSDWTSTLYYYLEALVACSSLVSLQWTHIKKED